ncbi:MAG: bifunctional (p)ppGpp synthetase/guanosine-3',5'-bis(diphosphate) 3'-pyrophosphohydrolase, partial [Firmicutes bacterium]|nr:bifunctional (p)ppGpp synthetase/guanosine-3',5'-bis(diphosphate) 3'-pyrophosphohydrolase [Bacillota bacterium]
QEELHKHVGKPSHGVYVKGQSGILVRFARCCNPVPGDEIVGFITRGRGVTVHKADCSNIHESEAERMIEVEWADTDAADFNATINIIAYDSVSLMGDLATSVNNAGAPIIGVAVKRDKKRRTSNVTMVVQVKTREELDKLIKALRRRTDVVEVYRGSS